MTDDCLILRHDAGAVRTLTLNRPAALNSLTGAMQVQLLAELDAAAADSGVRCLVITGAGRGFCAGQDLNDPELAQGVGAVVERHYLPLAQAVRRFPVPVLALVNGVAAGAGANLALGCDMVVAARSASFIQAFAKIALVPDCGGTWLLPRLLGRARALGLALTGDKLGAEQAERIGLIWRCVDDAALAAEGQALAERLAAMPARALALTRQALDAASTLDWSAALQREADLQGELGAARDFHEGVQAFLEKRAPRFTDR